MLRDRKTDVLFLIWSSGIGDTIAATPAIRVFCEQFDGRQVDVWTEYPELFKYNPHVARVHSGFQPDADFLKQWLLPNIKQPFLKNGEGPVYHYRSHLVSYCSINSIRSELTPIERQFEVPYGDEERDKAFELVKNIKKPKVVLHPNDTWKTRRMPAKTWSFLKDLLLLEGFEVILIGKDVGTRSTTEMDTKGAHDFINKLSILETIALLEWCDGIVTMDSGTLCMAGCTGIDIFCILTVNPACFRAPFRKGKRTYKFHEINNKTSCLYCGTQLDRIDRNIANCINYNSPMECLPSAQQIFRRIKEVL